jgi:hypothetical protein
MMYHEKKSIFSPKRLSKTTSILIVSTPFLFVVKAPFVQEQESKITKEYY